MTVLYAESSAVLTWMLGEPNQRAVLSALAGADVVVTSSLTLLECTRALLRARVAGRISAADERAAAGVFDAAIQTWHILDVSDDVLERAGRPFPREPVRSLDAVHLTSALVLQDNVGDVQMLSLDDRVRLNASALGMTVVPA